MLKIISLCFFRRDHSRTDCNRPTAWPRSPRTQPPAGCRPRRTPPSSPRLRSRPRLAARRRPPQAQSSPRQRRPRWGPRSARCPMHLPLARPTGRAPAPLPPTPPAPTCGTAQGGVAARRTRMAEVCKETLGHSRRVPRAPVRAARDIEELGDVLRCSAVTEAAAIGLRSRRAGMSGSRENRTHSGR